MSKDYGPAIHRESNYKKALSTLWGICYGISADREINEIELMFLRAWLGQHDNAGADDDVRSLAGKVAEVLRHEKLLKKHLQSLLKEVTRVYKFNSNVDFGFGSKKEAINELLGVTQGIMADGVLNNAEIKKLNTFVNKMDSDYSNEWPVSALRKRLKAVLADGVVTEEERVSLLSLIKAMGTDFVDTGSVDPVVAQLGVNHGAGIQFEGKSICFTGVFAFGPRSACRRAIEGLGAEFKNSISKKLDYLVVGSIVSADWAYSSYGQKVERAMQYQDEFGNPIVISEEEWVQAMEALGAGV